MPALQSVSPILAPTVADALTAARTVLASQHQAAELAARKLVTDRDTDLFTAQVAAQRQHLKSDWTAIIDRAYEGGIQLGQNAAASEQNDILSGMNMLMSALNDTLSAADAALGTLAASAADLLGGALDPAAGVAQLFAPAVAILA